MKILTDYAFEITYSDNIIADTEEEAVKQFIEIINKYPHFIKRFGKIEREGI